MSGAGHEDRRRGEQPGLSVDEPERDEERSQREEVVEQKVGLRVEVAADDTRRDEHEDDARPEDVGRDARGEQPRDRRGEATREEPELHVERDDVGGAHEVERRGLERRHERRVARVRELAEELLVEASEEVDRLRLRNPERPGVPGGERGEAGRSEERFQVDDDERRAREGDQRDPLRTRVG